MYRKKLITVLTLLFLSGIMVGCQMNTEKERDGHQHEKDVETVVPTDEGGKKAHVKVTMQNTEGEKIGEASLSQVEDGVLISLQASHLPPGLHGFHIHEKGMCEKPTFESAGPHFNPTNKKHGFDHPEGPHAGDLPNIEVKEDGTIQVEIVAKMVTLEMGKENSLLQDGGTSLVIHSEADDYYSQPAGNAGDRIACGVIKKE
ncbi:Cu-Zn family superoxide dismutase [Cerasibacillus quisquiliarum]|uniref:Superoxide dismutase [Cu-Zn] n=1 Tax=Cerasibacillus quisquiliarum TaxID=227865 RepID=A0A511UW36_9BACI|nr:superoxide dismutase family protein [Cerasibacillus quisquiliarum]MBB5146075.1 Cu-Zn family superoxide dismutase [Cerasibacillus quisquiliarum]GEN30807.1 hypothetical protein CQU01_10450 [Cerasibacillus quisquiliarum]